MRRKRTSTAEVSSRLCQGGRGHWPVYHTSPQSFIMTLFTLFVSSTTLRTLLNFGLLFKLSHQTFQPLIVIYITGHFVYHHWNCSSIYRPLSYPFRSLNNKPKMFQKNKTSTCVIDSFLATQPTEC